MLDGCREKHEEETAKTRSEKREEYETCKLVIALEVVQHSKRRGWI